MAALGRGAGRGGARRAEGGAAARAAVRLAPADGGCPVPLPPGETLLGRGPLLGVSEGAREAEGTGGEQPPAGAALPRLGLLLGGRGAERW